MNRPKGRNCDAIAQKVVLIVRSASQSQAVAQRHGVTAKMSDAATKCLAMFRFTKEDDSGADDDRDDEEENWNRFSFKT